MLKAAAVVVLYKPDFIVIENVKSYIYQVEKLFVVDNSETKETKITKNLYSFDNLIFVENNSNLGIAAAINKAADQAIIDGYDLLLTIDQDSKISENYIQKMISEFEKDDKIGILTPFLVHNKNPKKPIHNGIDKVTVAMTSGSIINLIAFQKAGRLLEKFFIDYADNEYCLRIQSAGFKVLKLNSVFVYHNLGNITAKKFFFWKVYPTNHSPERWYYRTRNRFYVYKNYKNKFKDYVRFDQILFVKETLKILFYETEKMQKFKMIIKGYLDYKADKFGKYKSGKFIS